MLSLAAACDRNKSDAGLDAPAPVLDLASCEQVTDLSDYIADVKIVRLAPRARHIQRFRKDSHI